MKPKTAYLVDRCGLVHGIHLFFEDAPQKSISIINPAVFVASGMKYTLRTADDADYSTHIEKLFTA